MTINTWQQGRYAFPRHISQVTTPHLKIIIRGLRPY